MVSPPPRKAGCRTATMANRMTKTAKGPTVCQRLRGANRRFAAGGWSGVASGAAVSTVTFSDISHHLLQQVDHRRSLDGQVEARGHLAVAHDEDLVAICRASSSVSASNSTAVPR